MASVKIDLETARDLLGSSVNRGSEAELKLLSFIESIPSLDDKELIELLYAIIVPLAGIVIKPFENADFLPSGNKSCRNGLYLAIVHCCYSRMPLKALKQYSFAKYMTHIL